MMKPELLAPAGSLEKLKVAILYGANAVYLGGQKFGLRAAAENFTEEELAIGVEFAHARKAKVYVTLNGFLYDQDIEELPSFLSFLESVRVDAVIVADLGVLKTVKDNSQLEVHLSTQASCLNTASAQFWKAAGVKRVILGREVSLEEAAIIQHQAGVEVEQFVHGSLCMSYSGNCVISNYTQGRDSNRGGCAHSCRFEYSIDDKRAFFMSSKDLEGIRLISEFGRLGLSSMKIEGRMKSVMYVGTITKIYREALDKSTTATEDDWQRWEQELRTVSHRGETQGSLMSQPGADSIYSQEHPSLQETKLAGSIVEASPEKGVLVQVKNTFSSGSTLEVLNFEGPNTSLETTEMTDLLQRKLDSTKPSTLVRFPYVQGLKPYQILRVCS